MTIAVTILFSVFVILFLQNTASELQEVNEVAESRSKHEIENPPLLTYIHPMATSINSKTSPAPTAKSRIFKTASPSRRLIPRSAGFSSAAPIYPKSYRPSHQPTLAPAKRFSNRQAIALATRPPTANPTVKPTINPTANPTVKPTTKPTKSPTTAPTRLPTAIPSKLPTAKPSWSPTARPTPLPTIAPTAAPTVSKAVRKYVRRTVLDSSNFLDAFVFETIDDPTHGTVDYISYAAAVQSGLAKPMGGKVYLGVDNTTTVSATSRGRKSLRLISKEVLNGDNLLIIDLDHMPSTVGNVLEKGCSIWPAFWTLGPQWPDTGEIDIIEYVNKNAMGNTALHTSLGCDMSSVPVNSFTSTWTLSSYGNPAVNCYVRATGQDQNSGCAVASPVGSVGSAFNSKSYVSRAVRTNNIPINAVSAVSSRGGVYAMQWDKESQIRTWYFPRDKVPIDLTDGAPKPDTWGLPYSHFIIGPGTNSKCGLNHFKDHRVVFDTTFCGDWAGESHLVPYSLCTVLHIADLSILHTFFMYCTFILNIFS